MGNMQKEFDLNKEILTSNEEIKPSVNQEQIHDILFNREIGWQEIIYDLINTEQLDPWDINIIILSDKYLKKIQELEESDFLVSSKVLLAASLLLRIKSEILLNKYIKSIDDILFGKKEEQKKYSLERIELDEEIPELIPRSPIPRYKKVTLKELMEALGKAIKTENRRIKKEVINKNALREAGISLPKKRFSIKDKILQIHQTILDYFTKNGGEQKILFSEHIATTREEKIASFSPLLHLENQKKIWLQQDKHFEEIHIWEHKTFHKENPNYLNDLINEIETQDHHEKIRYKNIKKVRDLKKHSKKKSVDEFLKESIENKKEG